MMPNMTLRVTEEEKEQYKSRSESHGISRSQWLRRCIRVATQLWDADGGFDRKALDAWFENLDRIEASMTPSDEEQESNFQTDEIGRLILRELSKSEPTDMEEIKNLVTEGIVNETLYDLQNEDLVENIPGRGYVKK